MAGNWLPTAFAPLLTSLFTPFLLCQVDLSAEMGTQAIVSSLEKDFDSWSKDHSSDPFLNSTWKAEANEQTMCEIPPIALTGLETGHFSGYGERMYMTRKDFDAAETLGSTSRIPPHLMDPKTKSWQVRWRGTRG